MKLQATAVAEELRQTQLFKGTKQQRCGVWAMAFGTS
jgi:hypothetical protein